jgi:YfiH family protein
MVTHHFFDRYGGVSRGDFTALNVSHGVGDNHDCVEENRCRVRKRMGDGRLISARQIHDNKIFDVNNDLRGDLEVDGFDALVTSRKNTILLIQQADCQAVLLHDPVEQVIAAIHCGWRGSVVGIIGKTVTVMQERYLSTPSNIKAFIGPSLGPCCAEFIHFKEELPEAFHSHQVKSAYFDFWEISRQQLVQAGLDSGNVEISGVCTSCSDDYFSYRRACRSGDGKTGRHCSAICLHE